MKKLIKCNYKQLFFTGNKYFQFLFILSVLFLISEMYLNTGTLSAYAVTIDDPMIRDGHIVNYDYLHHECNYNFIIGSNNETWVNGWILRRELFFIIAFPFFKLFGFYYGGIITAFVVTIFSYFIFIKFIVKTFGVQQAYVGMALFVSYPGIMYWIGSPFAHTMIVPCSCIIYILLWKMNETILLKKQLVYLSIVAILFTAYDLFVFFYPAILLIYFVKRQWIAFFCSFPIMILPQLLIIFWIKYQGVDHLVDNNSGVYATIINSYLHPGDLSLWWSSIKKVPNVLINNFTGSNFLFLPSLFLIILPWAFVKKFQMNRVEVFVLLSALLVFLFNNLAPPYIAYFSMQGKWIARIYQPIFIILIMFIVRFSVVAFKSNKMVKNIFVSLICLCFIGNTIINFGGCFKSKFTQWTWFNFYQHSSPSAMINNLNKYGVKPMGFDK